MPRTEKYNLEPYDDDDYEPTAKPTAAKNSRSDAQAPASLQRKLAQLELDVDREQGWIRGGSKTDVSHFHEAWSTGTSKRAHLRVKELTQLIMAGGRQKRLPNTYILREFPMLIKHYADLAEQGPQED